MPGLPWVVVEYVRFIVPNYLYIQIRTNVCKRRQGNMGDGKERLEAIVTALLKELSMEQLRAVYILVLRVAGK